MEKEPASTEQHSLPPQPPAAPRQPADALLEFLQRRLSCLEKDLSAERQRADAAAGMLQQQEALRAQVELQLKGMSETLRREKAEREGEEARERARGRIDVLEKRLDEMHQSLVTLLREAMAQRESARAQTSGSQEELARELAAIRQRLETPPAAKDKIIESLEAEKQELLRALSERGESLKAQAEQRLEVERTIAALNKDIDRLNARLQGFSSQSAALELDKGRLADELAGARRLLREKDERRAALEAEREDVVKALAAEAQAKRDLIEEGQRREQEWTARLEELQGKLAAESQARAQDTASLFDLRGQLSTLSEHLARALQERDSLAGRAAPWEEERAQLLRRLAEKENLISTLTATFQRLLGK
ncbi:MAG: hypothetical protein KGO96_08235 [Elusimicrobia bacterium]|nr:hypothetical protein [Elusimicrobiota bacterium]MDE2238001.1 hypothetical protein [Elusimicrobiota bacterium]MDE2425877.1 hypothetical protein [Elusimicrobiota bacterium]